MAKIYLKLAKTEPIYISNARAKPLAEDKKKFEAKEIENTWMDVDNFHGFLSDIRSIIFDDERRIENTVTTNFVPLTPKEVAEQKAQMKKVRENVFGKKIINNQYKD